MNDAGMPRSGAPPEGGVPPDAGPGPSTPSKKQPSRWGPLLRFLLKWTAVAALVAGVMIFVLGIHIQHGNRMYPFLMDGDLVITYKLEACRVGDVVAYRRPDTGQTALSRVVAVGPATVEATAQGELIVDGSVPSERVFYATKPLEGSSIAFPCEVPAGGYFLLDDYRGEGQDGRLFGPVDREALLGKVVYVLRRRGI